MKQPKLILRVLLVTQLSLFTASLGWAGPISSERDSLAPNSVEVNSVIQKWSREATPEEVAEAIEYLKEKLKVTTDYKFDAESIQELAGITIKWSLISTAAMAGAGLLSDLAILGPYESLTLLGDLSPIGVGVTVLGIVVWRGAQFVQREALKPDNKYADVSNLKELLSLPTPKILRYAKWNGDIGKMLVSAYLLEIRKDQISQ